MANPQAPERNLIDCDELSERLIADLKAGRSKEESFRQLFHLHYRSILGFFIKRGQFSLQECEDLAQETFFRVYRGAPNFRREVKFKSWLFQIAVNVYRSAIEKLRAAKREGLEVPLEGDPETQGTTPLPIFSEEEDPLDQVIDGERLELLRQAMDELPDQMRRCITLRIGEGLKYREIAEVMQISVQTVKAHLAQARERLRGIIYARLDEAKLEAAGEWEKR